MAIQTILPVAAIGVGCAVLVFLILQSLFRVDQRVLHRIRDLEERASVASIEHGSASRDSEKSCLHRWFSPPHSESRDELRTRLAQAGFTSAGSAPAFVAFQLLSAAFFGGLAILVLRWTSSRADLLLPSLIGVCSGYLLPTELLRRRMLKRRRIYERAIPDYLDLLIACIDGGLSLEGAMQKITPEISTAHPMLGLEMQRVQRDVELGSPPDRALQALAERSNLDALRTLATACSQARRFGSRLTQTLRTLAESLRQQREQRAEEAAQAAAVKILLPTLLLLFPIIFVVLAGPAAIQISEQFSQTGMNDAR